MKRKVFSLMLALIAILTGMTSGYAQQLTPLPEMPGLRTGKLPNGLTYFVLHNEEPKGKANFYIAQKVGSTLENKDQLGLAHFLEHMAFNGTKNYPGKAMLNYLQAKGLRFGLDINAYTSFDETVYRVENVPTSDVALMDSCLLVLHDWSCALELEDDEIEAERGVIQEEWRSRNDAGNRYWTKMLKEVYDEYQYQQMPIGTMDVVMNFKPDVLRDYYHMWYRPDQQGIIVVGDFDAAEMEKKVIDLFSAIPMPAGVPERTYPVVSDNVEPKYVEFEDPELRQPSVRLCFKTDIVPFEYRNTVEAGLLPDLMKDMISTMLYNRLNEYAQEPNCQYMRAFAFFDSFLVSKTKDSFTIYVETKDDIVAGFKDALEIVVRACKTGFTSSELERAMTEILSDKEKAYNEREKTNTKVRAEEIIKHFVDNVAAPGAEAEYQMAQMILPNIPVEQYNMVCQELLTPENRVLLVQQPQNDRMSLPGREKMLNTLNEVIAAEYEPYEDVQITENIVNEMLPAGKIVSETFNEKYQATELMLSNGVKVIVKPTDYKADEIAMSFFKMGGQMAYPVSEAANLQQISNALDASRLGNYDVKTLNRYLSGKVLSLSFGIGMRNTAFNGSASVKDFPTLLELLYVSMTEVNPDADQYAVETDRLVKKLALAETTPDYIFSNKMYSTVWNDNPTMAIQSVANIQSADYQKMIEMIKAATANAADYTMVLVGNVDLATLRPLLETYIASLPSTGVKTEPVVLNPIALAQGDVVNSFEVEMQTPQVRVLNYYVAPADYTMENEVIYGLLGDVIDNNFTQTLREEEGGTYSPSAFASMYPASKQGTIAYFFITNDEVAQRLQERAKKEMFGIMANGTNADEFNKVREAAISVLDTESRTNGFVLGDIVSMEQGYDLYTGRTEYLRNLTLEQFNAAIKNLVSEKNRIQVIMTGVQAK